MEAHRKAFHKLCRQMTTNLKLYHDPYLTIFLEQDTQQYHKYFLRHYDQKYFLLKDQSQQFLHIHHDLQEHFLV